MILEDLFEQRPLPPHIKPSDLPPAMRAPLTMRDVEAERPQGAFRFRVIPRQAGESPKAFLTLQSAQQHAQAVGGRVEPIREQDLHEQEIDIPASMSVPNRGALIMSAIEQDRREFTPNSRRPIRFNMGGEQFLISDPAVKKQIYSMATEYNKRGQLETFLLNLGQNDSLHFLLNKLAGPTDLPVGGQKSSPRAPRYAREGQVLKKKSELAEVDAPKGATTRTQRMMAQIRARQPQATSDLEALAYDMEDQRRRDQTEIDNLEREVDGLESDIKKELRQQVQQLRGRRDVNVDVLRQIQARDREQADAINKILKVNKDQQQAIDDLEQVSQRPRVRAKADGPREKTAAAADAIQPVTRQAEPIVVSPDIAQNLAATRAQKQQAAAAAAQAQLTTSPKITAAQPEPVPAVSVAAPVSAPIAGQPSLIEPETLTITPGAAGQQFAEPTVSTDQRARRKKTARVGVPAAKKKTAKKDQPVATPDNVLQFRRPPVQRSLPLGRTGTTGESIEEAKKKPQPTNPGLWSRAKSAARSKFDVYPSAYANAWAAKWYKSKGGGWRMGKPKKK